MEKSTEINELITALSRAQAEFPAVPLNATNPFLHNRYADLGSVILTVKEILSNHGLSVTQLVKNDGASVGITTMLAHSSGQWVSESACLPLPDAKGQSLAQVAGSTITYLRRYAYTSILGLYTGEDDDGGDPQRGKTEKKSEVKASPKESTDATIQTRTVVQPVVQDASVEMVTLSDGKTQKPANDLVSKEYIEAFEKHFVGNGLAFDAPQHLKNHLRKHFQVDYLKELTWRKFAALANHAKGTGDDPKYYPKEPESQVVDADRVKKIADSLGVDLVTLLDVDHVNKSLESMTSDQLATVSSILETTIPDPIAADDLDNLTHVIQEVLK